jgi:hypothetical protein
LSTTSSGKVGAPATNAAGQADAFANAANLMSVASGAALSSTPAGGGTAPQEISTRLPTRWQHALRPADLPRRIARSRFTARSPGRRSIPGRAREAPGRLPIPWLPRCRSHAIRHSCRSPG